MKVIRGGREVCQIERPLHMIAGRKAVVFRRRLWAVQRGNRIEIDKAPIRKETGNETESAPRAPGNGAPVLAARNTGNRSVKYDGSRRGKRQRLEVRDSSETSSYRVRAVSDDAALNVPAQWDSKQLEVIEAPREAQLLVDAGPGTGKTAVACRRVAWLIDENGASPGNIWLISFTRTAVREIRNRIRHYLQDPADVFSVKVATIDSHAWAIHSGFDAEASLAGTYEDNIERVTTLVRQNKGVFEYLENVEHVIIDEAQDIVGVRADLLMELIRQLPAKCGITVFADEAQAIYGFADEDGHSMESEGHLPQRLRESGGLRFRECALSTIYRTDKKTLRKLFSEVRAKLLAPDSCPAGERLDHITDMVRALADDEATINALDRENEEALHSTFVLFRRRIDVLTEASFWGTAPHRLRMSGLPTLLEAWLSVMLWDFTERRLKRLEFERLWGERVEQAALAATTEDRAWEALVKAAGESRTVVSMPLLRAKLGRASPPNDFIRPDFGLGGPVFGTIHGCKGREADSVLLMLPTAKAKESDDDEEARVIFVGATRAKMELRVGKGYKFLKSRRLDGGRVYAPKTSNGKPDAQIEFGRIGDLDAEGVAGTRLFRSADEVANAHQWLLSNATTIAPASAEPVAQLGWRYRVTTGGDGPIAFFAEGVNRDLFEIGRDVQQILGWRKSLRPAYGPKHLRTFGASTIVLRPDDVQKNCLHEPWATSGFLLAPVLQGFAMIYFKAY